VVDMRWGVRDEATDDHMTTELCMREIVNCQRLSMGPNFVVFLGQKYGYRPIPTYILATELTLLKETLQQMGVDTHLLDLWYKVDKNAVPAMMILQPISTILVNFNNKRYQTERYACSQIAKSRPGNLWDTLNKMQKLLRKAAHMCNVNGKMDHDAMHNYFMSVTEREVINGVLNVQNTKTSCIAYKASNFIDIINRGIDAEAARLLGNLRDERLPNKIEASNMQKYTIEWMGREGISKDTHDEYLSNFLAHFYKSITKLVDRAMRKEDSSAQGVIVTEILQHLHACNNSVKQCSCPMLISLCQQISYNFMLPMEDIPDDLVPLTAHFKQLITYGTAEQPLIVFLDSVDQLTGASGANKLTWLPSKIPKHCKIVISCVNEPEEPEISRDYVLLRRILDAEDHFIEVTSLGEKLATQVMRKWLIAACRDVTNYQWRVVCNALAECSLPIFVKLVFAETCRWKSYSKPNDTLLATNVMDSIFKLFERIEMQHGKLLVMHALAYVTAAKSGLSETELEDLISMDDKVLDDVYQYHLPPVRRIPPLLWTRIRNDLPNYLSEREADGVSVLSWYHRQFRDAAKERYFKDEAMSIYFHSSIADYFLGIWGGGNPKPF
ncbi:NACHT and WD repeat domain-containing protein 2, partial [Orchesella cincta]